MNDPAMAKWGSTTQSKVKTEFAQENYLHLDLSYQQLKKFAQFRTSSHRFKIETGRQGVLRSRNSVLNRICNCCSTDDMETLRALESLPESQSCMILFNPDGRSCSCDHENNVNVIA